MLLAAIIRNDCSETVYDSTDNLTWKDNSYVASASGKRNWNDAITYCQDLEYAGVDDWYLPDQGKLYSLYPKKSDLSNVANDNYWSSTEGTSNDGKANSFPFSDGEFNGDDYRDTSDLLYVRCVRDAQISLPDFSITLDNTTIAPNLPVGTVVGTIDAGSASAITLGCSTPGENDGNFVIDGNSLKTATVFAQISPTRQNICIQATNCIDTHELNVTITVDSLLWSADGDQSQARFGENMARAGDVNNDGYEDLIVGAPYYDNGETDEGRAYLYLGSANGLPNDANWSAESNQANAHFGAIVAGAGDVNNDGYDDILISAPDFNGSAGDNSGKVYLYLGSASGLSATPDWSVEGNESNLRYGLSLSSGDLNDDNSSDILIGSISRVDLFYGSALASAPDLSFNGVTVASPGDVNGDDYDDVVIGSPGFDGSEGTDSGKVELYLGGASMDTTADWSYEGTKTNANFGSALTSAGDVDGDGYDDLLVGVAGYDVDEPEDPDYNNAGAFYLFYGKSDANLGARTFSKESDIDWAHLGSAVASAGDVNGDGFDDILVGAHQYSNSLTYEGRVYLYHGSGSGLSESNVKHFESDQLRAKLGHSVAGADVNGDGFSDLFGGAYLYDNGETDEGSVFMLPQPEVPVITQTPPTAIAEDSNYSFTLQNRDAEGNTLRWSVASGSTPPSWLILNGDWLTVGSAGFSAGAASYTSLAIDGSGTPYVAYEDSGNYYKTTVMRFNGSTWEAVGSAGFSNSGVVDISLAIDGNGTPYVAYKDYVNSFKATVMRFNGSSWELVGSAGFSAAAANYTSLAIDGNGTPYVAYQDYGNSYKATVMRFNGNSWEVLGSAGFSAGEVYYTSLAIDGSGTPYVAYKDYGNKHKATVMRFNGSSWEPVGSAGFSAGEVYFTSLAIDGSDTPYVAYKDSGNYYKTTVMKFNGNTWEPVGSAGFSAGEASYTSLAIDGSGTPYVAYSDSGNGSKATVMGIDILNLAGKPGNDAVGTHDVNLSVTDGYYYLNQNFQITVTNTNDAPIDIILSNNEIVERNSIGDLVGSLSVTDVDSGDSHSYTLTCNDANFSISTVNLNADIVFDYDVTPQQEICVRVTDAAGAFYDENLTITILALAQINEIDFDQLNQNPPVLDPNNNVYILSFKVSDIYGGTLAVQVSSSYPNLVSVSPSNIQLIQAADYNTALNFSLAKVGDATGTATITVEVVSSLGTVSKTFDVNVEALNGFNPSIIMYLLN